MIRLKVEWHLECRSCGTELVTDFFESDDPEYVCPWCGCRANEPEDCSETGLKDYLRSAVRELEDEANTRTLS